MPKSLKNPTQKEAASFISVQDFAAARSISIRFTRDEIYRGKIGVCRFGRRVVIPAAEAERYDREHFIAPVNAKANARDLLQK